MRIEVEGFDDCVIKGSTNGVIIHFGKGQQYLIFQCFEGSCEDGACLSAVMGEIGNGDGAESVKGEGGVRGFFVVAGSEQGENTDAGIQIRGERQRCFIRFVVWSARYPPRADRGSIQNDSRDVDRRQPEL